jgi:hypothetical protein
MDEYLDMQRLCAKGLLRLLTIDQNQQFVHDSKQCLTVFNPNKDEFNTQEYNRQSAEWTERDEPNPKRVKTQRLAGISITGWACYYIHRLPQKLERLNDEIKKKRPHLKKKNLLFHQENAPVHKSIKTTAKSHELGYELLPHPPYSPDLATSDFSLFANLKKI